VRKINGLAFVTKWMVYSMPAGSIKYVKSINMPINR